MSKDEHFIEAIEMYLTIKKSLHVMYKEDMMSCPDPIVLDHISLLVQNMKGEPLEDIDDLFSNLVKLIESLDKAPELQIDVEIYDDDITKTIGYIVADNVVFVPVKSAKEVYVKYQNLIYSPVKIISNDEYTITLLQFKDHIFKNTFSFDTTNMTEGEGVEIVEDKITKYGKIPGKDLKRIFECIISEKPIVPEVEVVACNFKDFVGRVFIKGAVKISKINHGDAYKVGDILSPDGRVIKFE